MPTDDATTQSRIRDAAIARFGRDGFAATTVRAIAEAASVSPGLVIHHFGSKERLRLACDEFVVSEIAGRNDATLDSPDLAATMQRWLADVDTYRGVLDYLGRMLMDESELGDRLFDRLLETTQNSLAAGEEAGVITPSSDARMRAVVLTAQGLITLLLERHIARAFGETGLNESVVRRMTMPTLELYTNGLYRDDTMLRAARGAL
ncbi:MAG: TetR family transcriptional regulator, partial [Rhodoglobus sp.]|nr:TetR family transcriptional regulator [Rhodoglobus sp.]